MDVAPDGNDDYLPNASDRVSLINTNNKYIDHFVTDDIDEISEDIISTDMAKCYPSVALKSKSDISKGGNYARSSDNLETSNSIDVTERKKLVIEKSQDLHEKKSEGNLDSSETASRLTPISSTLRKKKRSSTSISPFIVKDISVILEHEDEDDEHGISQNTSFSKSKFYRNTQMRKAHTQ